MNDLPAPPATFGQNARAMWRHFSTWVAIASTTAAGVWLQLDPAQQAAILGAVPALKVIGPGLSFVAFVIAKAIPQPPREP